MLRIRLRTFRSGQRETRKITSILPAAGIGKRMNRRAVVCPKPFLRLCDNKRPIDHNLDALSLAQVDKAFIVVSGSAFEVSDYDSDLSITYVRQPKPTGLGDALMLALETIQRSDQAQNILVCMPDTVFADHYAISEFINKAFISSGHCYVGVCYEARKHVISDSSCAEIDQSGFVSRVIEKPSSPSTMLRVCGPWLVPRALCELHSSTFYRNSGISELVQAIINDDHHVKAVMMPPNVNINTRADLDEANHLLKW
jgi:NDP-sugar pyrophosphorylase family protein